MSNAEDFWRPIINDFEPMGAVRLDQVRRFFVDRYDSYTDKSERDKGKKPPSVLRRIRNQIRNRRNQPEQYKALLTGHVGCGKSFELIKLGEELAQDFFVVWLDAELTLAGDRANHFDVLLAIGLAVHKVAGTSDLHPDESRPQRLLNSLMKFVHKRETKKEFKLDLKQLLKAVSAIGIGAGVGGTSFGLVGAVAGAAMAAAKVDLNISDDLVRTLELPANSEEVVGALNEIINWVRNESKRPVLVLVDGLDKIPASRARLLFAESALLRSPNCALIYAAPIEFYHRAHSWQANNIFDDHHLLPNVVVAGRPLRGEQWRAAREENPDGVEMMRRIVATRLATRNLSCDQVIAPEALTLLAQMSGGIARDMVRLFRDAAVCAQAEEEALIDELQARQAVSEWRQATDNKLTLPHREALKLILKQGVLSGDKLQETEDELLRNVYLLSYQQESGSWLDAHPIIFPHL